MPSENPTLEQYLTNAREVTGRGLAAFA